MIIAINITTSRVPEIKMTIKVQSIRNQFYSNQLHYLQALITTNRLCNDSTPSAENREMINHKTNSTPMKKVNRCVPQSIQHKICLPSVRLLIARRRILSMSPPCRITCKQVWTHSSYKSDNAYT